MREYIISTILCIILVGSFVAYNNPINDDKWCERNKPTMNISGEKSSYCFNEGWEKYCKISFPEYCPNNNYTELDRCLRNCATYGYIENCPCLEE